MFIACPLVFLDGLCYSEREKGCERRIRAMKRWFCLTLCALLVFACRPPVAAEEAGRPWDGWPLVHAEEENRLVKCEYTIFGGMENESLEMTLTPGQAADELWVREVRGNVVCVDQTYQASDRALSDLEKLIAAYQPETWAELPYAEFQALDAPTRLIRVQYADGTEYSISNSKQSPPGSGPLFYEVRCFLESYSVTAETARLSFHTYGGGPDYTLTLDAPEKVDWYATETLDEPPAPGQPLPPGSGYTITYVFRGRIPGDVTATVRVHHPVVGFDDWYEVYTLRVDNDYNVTVIPQEGD